MKMYHVTCPLCGQNLFKTTQIDYLELECSKCHAKLNIAMKNNRLVVDEYLGITRTRAVAGKRMEGYRKETQERTIKESRDVVLCV